MQQIQGSKFIAGLPIFFLPSMASACNMGALGYAGLGEALMMAFAIFLAGYLPYLIASIKLAQETRSPEGTKRGTRIVANIFAGINTTVFVLGLFMLLVNVPSPLIILGDFILWGVPFLFYLKGLKGTRAVYSTNSSDLLDA